MSPPRTLTIVTAAPHFEWQGRLWSHAPYVREIDLWAHLFDHVRIVGPTEPGPPTGDCIPFESPGLELTGVPPTGGDELVDKVRQVLLLPLLIWRVVRAVRASDAAHVRCPGNIGLLGVLVVPLVSRRMVAKYAGQWNGFPGEKWTVRLQRAVLSSPWWRGPVTVYGDWPDQPRHVVPFFTSVLSGDQVAQARRHRRAPRRAGELRLLYVGRLSGPKNVGAIVRATAALCRRGLSVRCSIVGDGAERDALEQLARDEGVDHLVTFTGAVGMDAVLAQYEQADTLVLVSQSEGWPKAVAEAMAFGLVCVGSARGMLPQMLGEGRGVVVPPEDLDALVDALHAIARDPAHADAMAARAAAWGQRHSLEKLEAALADLLTQWWGAPIGAPARTTVLHVTDTLAAGGAERMAVNLANGMQRDRYRVALCTTRRSGILEEQLAADVARVALRRTTRRRDLGAVLELARYLRELDVDVVHAHGTSLFIGAAACALTPRARLVWHDHLGANVASGPWRRWLYRIGASRADQVITVTRDLQRWAVVTLGLPEDRVTTVPNFVSQSGPTAVPELPGCPEARVVCVANLRREKDHLTLVTALAEVVLEVPGAHGLLVGTYSDGEVVADVEARISALGIDDHVSLLGPRTDVDAILSGCAIGVLTSRSEGFPLALLEYGNHALPTVATDVGECAEILGHGTAGRLVPPGDSHAVAAAVAELLADPATATDLGERLHRRVQETYSADAVMSRVDRIYARALRRGRSPAERP